MSQGGVSTASEPPFNNTDALDILRLVKGHEQISGTAYPTLVHNTPQDEIDLVDYIPGEPAIPLAGSDDFLQRELATPLLDELYNELHLFAKKLSCGIDALHEQILQGRCIVLVEDPQLHLILMGSSILIKPIPICLLNYDFWTHHLAASLSVTLAPSMVHSPAADHLFGAADSYRAMALGFLRSYSQLIQHQSDFRIAKDNGLIPEDITWARWSKFICGFRPLQDEMIARRYHFGQLRLLRLSWVAFFFRPKSAGDRIWHYRVSVSKWELTQSYLLLIAFVLALFSVVLSAMQVMLTIPDDSLLATGISQGVDEIRTEKSYMWSVSYLAVVFTILISLLLILINLSSAVGLVFWGIWQCRRKWWRPDAEHSSSY